MIGVYFDSVKRTRYKAVPVRETLVEMKNTSELTIDLAYSSLLLNNTFLAEEVQQLYQRTESINIDLEQLLLSCQLIGDDSKGLISLVRMGMAAERIAFVASKIAQVVLRGIEPHPVLKMMIQSADETVEHVVVPDDSPIIGKNLKVPIETSISDGLTTIGLLIALTLLL
jgi:uncharacterized protein with PhoU and TrkA domain